MDESDKKMKMYSRVVFVFCLGFLFSCDNQQGSEMSTSDLKRVEDSLAETRKNANKKDVKDEVKKEEKKVVRKLTKAEKIAMAIRKRLLDVKHKDNNKKAPDVFEVEFKTSRGTFVVKVHRAWAPVGADRFYNMVNNHYFDGCRFFRMVRGFVAQFGMNGDPVINKAWSESTLKDEPVLRSNKRGYLTFAKTRLPDSRSNQFFINYANNGRLDGMGFSPFAEIIKGMDVVDNMFMGYEQRPNQDKISAQGNEYLKREFPSLDYVKSTKVLMQDAKKK
jgi:peptidyl-prolyl cis-trans isomerase A (cyclophilin A)